MVLTGKKKKEREGDMIEQYKTIYRGGQAEIVEKKSRFIASLRYVENEESALEFVEQVKSSTGMPDITAGLMRSDSARKRCGAATTASRRERPGNRCWTCCSAQGYVMRQLW